MTARWSPGARHLRWLLASQLLGAGWAVKQVAYEFGLSAGRVRQIVRERGAAAQCARMKRRRRLAA